MLKKLYIDNYKCLVNFEMKFDGMNLLIGQNGIGKSSTLEVLYAVQRLLQGHPIERLFSIYTLTAWQDSYIQTFELTITIEDPENSGEEIDLVYRLEIDHNKEKNLSRVLKESLTQEGKFLFLCELGKVTLYRDDNSKGPEYTTDWEESALARVGYGDDNKKLQAFKGSIAKMIICHLNTEYVHIPEVGLSWDGYLLSWFGGGFMPWLGDKLSTQPSLSHDYTVALREVIDSFWEIVVRELKFQGKDSFIRFRKDSIQYELPLSQVSDGQRMLIVLYALLYMNKGLGYSLFIDEPANYLALTEIQPWLQELSDAVIEGEIPQVVLASHNPEFIDYLGPESGILFQRDGSGNTRIGDLKKLIFDGSLRLSEIIARGWDNE